MRRLGFATSSSLLLLLLACSPSTGGIADGGGDDEETGSTGDGDPSGDGDGDPSGDGDGEPSGDGDGEPSGDGDGDNGCTTMGCACDGTPESCDNTLMCIDGTCVAFNCGNGVPENGEECDDGNRVDGDGCESDCTDTVIEQVVAGGRHSCALIEGGGIRCWGEGLSGVVGLGNTEAIGDDESPSVLSDIPLPGAGVAIDVGNSFICASFADDEIRCWGVGAVGQLGNADNATVGDDETLEMLPGIDLGGVPSQFSLGGAHACSRFPNGEVRCWGHNDEGQLGIGSTKNIGDNEAPASIDPVDVPDSITVAAGGDHSCAVTTDFQLFCWGFNDKGQLGYGNTDSIGDGANESPATVGEVDLYPASLPNDAKLSEVSLGKEHSCARFSSGDVLCWGRNDYGELGQGNTDDWGNNNSEAPADLNPIILGGSATAISAGGHHTCALLENGKVRCWGRNDKGQLGLGQPGDIGDGELPNTAATVELGGSAVAISAGYEHNCALLESNEIVCWGENSDGRLGYGHKNRIGDDETPASAGSVEIF